MKKVSELFKAKAVKGDVGVEIEVEGKGLSLVDDAVWRTESDGSLRGEFPKTCAEYIFQTPIVVSAVKAAIMSLKESLGPKAVFEFSYRTSVHVHVNVQKLEYQQLLAMMYTYLLLEEPLTTFAGKKRKGNNFCLRAIDAEGLIDMLNQLFEMGEQGPLMIRNDAVRYSAMNIEALKKYGSLEFRAMEGNIDEERIQTWCSALVMVREYGEALGTPEAVYDRFNALGVDAFMDDVLGHLSHLFKYAKVERDVLTSFSITLDLPFAFKRFLKALKARGEAKWVVGDLLGYDDAIKAQAEGCVLKGQANGLYKVVGLPVAMKAPKFKKPEPKMDADGWIIHDDVDMPEEIEPAPAWPQLRAEDFRVVFNNPDAIAFAPAPPARRGR